eukprot:TRINITY_DN5126_c0_g1_i1.p1 TRINITY_DN5126_c0_g1~~TRINITY_DN5126_c0_g1_i1.p1  ORF type:complete len:334 (+),score=118.12 TRINITY_DN5126_c0_g1_i1:447-1448(+)
MFEPAAATSLDGMCSPDSGVGLYDADIPFVFEAEPGQGTAAGGGAIIGGDVNMLQGSTLADSQQQSWYGMTDDMLSTSGRNFDLDLNMISDKDLFDIDLDIINNSAASVDSKSPNSVVESDDSNTSIHTAAVPCGQQQESIDDRLGGAVENNEETAEDAAMDDDNIQAPLSPPPCVKIPLSKSSKAAEASAVIRRNKKKLTPDQVLRKLKQTPATSNISKRKRQAAKKSSSSKTSNTANSSCKLKLYEVDQPLKDPEAEKCRLNAINAKKNRDRKKAQLSMAVAEISRLQTENAELRGEVEDVREELAEALHEIKQLKALMKLAGLPVEEREE